MHGRACERGRVQRLNSPLALAREPFRHSQPADKWVFPVSEGGSLCVSVLLVAEKRKIIDGGRGALSLAWGITLRSSFIVAAFTGSSLRAVSRSVVPRKQPWGLIGNLFSFQFIAGFQNFTGVFFIARLFPA